MIEHWIDGVIYSIGLTTLTVIFGAGLFSIIALVFSKLEEGDD